MERRLKKQCSRLFRRVTLILSAVWLFGFITFCYICVRNERINLQNSTLLDLAYARNVFSGSDRKSLDAGYVYLNTYSLMYFKNLIGLGNDVQLMVIDPETQNVLADTAGKLELKFSFLTDKGRYPDDYCYLNRDTFLDVISDSQLERIAQLLDERRKDGREHQLVCSEFYSLNGEIVPLELSVILTDGGKKEHSESEIIETFRMSAPKSRNVKIFYCSEDYDNVIPGDFLFGDRYNRDLISLLTDEQRGQSSAVVKAGIAEYIFYTSDYFYINSYTYSEEDNVHYNQPKTFLLRYAKKVNLIKKRLSDLLARLGVLSFFYLTIDALLCLVIWRSFKKQLVQEQRRRDLTNALAHDIKTPLFVISGYAYSLKEDIVPEERESSLNRIIGQTEQINGMVHRMLNLSKLDSYVMTLNRSEFDLNELTEEVLNDFTVLPDGKRIEAVHSGNSLISADRELIRTVIQNLIDNAVKYSLPDNRITIDVTDQSFRIANPTEPLTKSELKKIWQPYYRQDKSRHKKGNGLGLSIVKAILDLHKADYNVSVKDGVITFLVEF